MVLMHDEQLMRTQQRDFAVAELHNIAVATAVVEERIAFMDVALESGTMLHCHGTCESHEGSRLEEEVRHYWPPRMPLNVVQLSFFKFSCIPLKDT